MAVKKPRLNLSYPPSTRGAPPTTLGQPGTTLWQSIMSEYRLDDVSRLEMLAQICAAADRAAECAAAIARDGPVIETKTGPRDHPLLRHELGARAFVVRSLNRLFDQQEKRDGPGRPGSGGVGITYKQLRNMGVT